MDISEIISFRSERRLKEPGGKLTIVAFSNVTTVSRFISLIAGSFCLSRCSLCSCFPCPSSLCFLPALLLSWLQRHTCPAFTGNQHTRYMAISRVYSCYFQVSHDRFVFDRVFSLFSFGLSSVAQSVSPLVLLVIFDSGLFVLPCSLFSHSVVTFLFFLECRAQSLFPLSVVLCVLLPVSSWTISVGLLDCFCTRVPFLWHVAANKFYKTRIVSHLDLKSTINTRSSPL